MWHLFLSCHPGCSYRLNWYNGYYYLYGITHKFSEGQFTQDLNMISLPNESLILEKQQADITECGSDKVEKATDSEGNEPTANAAKAASQTTKEKRLQRIREGLASGAFG